MENFIDYYKVLGINKDATNEEIRKAYRGLAILWHPDRFPTEEEKKQAEEQMKKINSAYEGLGGKKSGESQKQIRAEYDKKWQAHYEYIKQRQRASQQDQRAQYSRGTTQQEARHDQRNQYSRGTTQQGTQYSRRTAQQGAQHSQRTAQHASNHNFRDNIKEAKAQVRADEKKNPFRNRHRNIERNYVKADEARRTKTGYFKGQNGEKVYHQFVPERSSFEDVIFKIKKGTVHVTAEFLYQLSKLKYITEDSIPKYVYRNRITAGILAAGICLGCFGLPNKNVDIPEPPRYTAEQSENNETKDEIILNDGKAEEEVMKAREYVLYRLDEVEMGDSLSQIAEDANCSMSEIQRLNNITDPSHIEVGQQITVPYHVANEDIKYATYSEQYTPGTSVSDFAKKHQTTAETLYRLNEEAFDETGNIIADQVLVPNFSTPEQIRLQREMHNKQ